MHSFLRTSEPKFTHSIPRRPEIIKGLCELPHRGSSQIVHSLPLGGFVMRKHISFAIAAAILGLAMVFCVIGSLVTGEPRQNPIAPRAPHRSRLDTLASSGSCHRTKAAAFRRELELLLLPVGSLPTAMTCPLPSTSITPASALLQGSPPLSGASVLSASRLEPLAPFPLPSPARFSRSIPEPD